MVRPTYSDFHKLFNEHILCHLYEAEELRKRIILNYAVIGSVLFTGFVIEAVTWMSLAIVIIVLFVMVYIKWFGIPVSRFEQLHCNAIIVNTIKYISAGLQFDSQSHLKLKNIVLYGCSKWKSPIVKSDYSFGKYFPPIKINLL